MDLSGSITLCSPQNSGFEKPVALSFRIMFALNLSLEFNLVLSGSVFQSVTAGIPRERVLVHRDVKGTECPGQHFPAQEFLAPRRDVPRAYR